MRLNKKGMNMLEYVLLWIALIAAILIMGRFFKLRIQGKIKANADEFGSREQYDLSLSTDSGDTVTTP